jgi:hypothetical protein
MICERRALGPERTLMRMDVSKMGHKEKDLLKESLLQPPASGNANLQSPLAPVHASERLRFTASSCPQRPFLFLG